MPSTYAHYKLGQEVKNKLTQPLEKLVKKYKNLYNIGLHGPDILFYYHPLFINSINTIGFSLHEYSGKELFSKYADILKSYNLNNEIEKKSFYRSLSYIIGFLCHYTLDSNAHSYIENKIKISDISHTEIEVEFDRYLMINDGFNPLVHSLTTHIKYDNLLCETISPFFFNTTTYDIKASLKGMIFYNKLLLCPRTLKRAFVLSLLHATKNYKEMHGLIVNKNPNIKCQDSNIRLLKIFHNSINDSVNLINQFIDLLFKDIELSDRFNLIFGANNGWEDIPVLSYEEESIYEIHT